MMTPSVCLILYLVTACSSTGTRSGEPGFALPDNTNHSHREALVRSLSSRVEEKNVYNHEYSDLLHFYQLDYDEDDVAGVDPVDDDPRPPHHPASSGNIAKPGPTSATHVANARRITQGGRNASHSDVMKNTDVRKSDGSRKSDIIVWDIVSVDEDSQPASRDDITQEVRLKRSVLVDDFLPLREERRSLEDENEADESGEGSGESTDSTNVSWQPTATYEPPTAAPPLVLPGDLGNKTVTVSLTLRFSGVCDDVSDSNSPEYAEVKRDSEDTLTAAYTIMVGFIRVSVTGFCSAERQTTSGARNDDVGIIADYEALFAMQTVSERYDDAGQLMRGIREDVLPLLRNSLVGSAEVDGDYIDNQVENELNDQENDLNNEFSLACNLDGVCSSCRQCHVDGVKVTCPLLCSCRDGFLPVGGSTSCVHRDLIIGVTLGVIAFVILVVVVVVAVFLARKKKTFKSYQLSDYYDLSYDTQHVYANQASSSLDALNRDNPGMPSSRTRQYNL